MHFLLKQVLAFCYAEVSEVPCQTFFQLQGTLQIANTLIQLKQCENKLINRNQLQVILSYSIKTLFQQIIQFARIDYFAKIFSQFQFFAKSLKNINLRKIFLKLKTLRKICEINKKNSCLKSYIQLLLQVEVYLKIVKSNDRDSSTSQIIMEMIATSAERKEAEIAVFDPKELEGRLSSKSDWYKYLVFHKGCYLPSYRRTTMRFIKDFLAGDKELFKTADIQRINVPYFKELSVGSILEEVKVDKEVMKYLNYYQDEKRLPERLFLFGVLCTLHPKYLRDLVRAQNRARETCCSEKRPENLIRVREDILHRLKNEPFFSKRKGRALCMLKSGAKPRKDANKKRKLHELEVKFIDLDQTQEDRAQSVIGGLESKAGNLAKRRKMNQDDKV